MNITPNRRKYLSVLVVGLLPGVALASVEADRSCEGDFCWSVTKHRSEHLKDYYVYVQSQAIKNLVVRYQSGAQINVLIQDGSSRNCADSFIKVKISTSSLAMGEGCLVTKQGGKGVIFKYQVSAANVPRFLHAVAPVVWLSGYSRSGDFLPAASALIALDGK
ncbi:hypothetical protein [Xanthomonas sacchari]|uniref:hypothetical protein n=1 Tax=Xanthomonas sacchari TaxID=56458 RepID=UPI0011106788|nr:hypothetical protein [Xanthomonas sacchari]MDV0438414.1 hypothetical protein [Xanthomonas sacchari]